MPMPWEKYAKPAAPAPSDGPWAKYGQQQKLPDTNVTADAPNGLGSDWQNFAAGMGKSFVDSARGLAENVTAPLSQSLAPFKVIDEIAVKRGAQPQFAGETKIANMDSQLKADQADANKRDAPLMGTKSGLAGNITGYASQLLAPGAALKAREALLGAETSPLTSALLPQTLDGAVKQGAATGLAQPLATGQGQQDRLRNGVIAAGAGAAGQVLPQIVGRAFGPIKAAIAPFTKSGKISILADALARFGDGGNLTPTPSAVRGVNPTLSEATGNAGLASLQRVLSTLDGNTTNQFADRQAANNAARLAALHRAFGDQSTIDAATAAREQGTAGLYDLASTLDQVRAADAKAVTDKATQQAAAKAEAANNAAIEAAKQQKAVALGSDVAPPDIAHAPTYSLEPTPDLKALARRPAMLVAIAKANRLAANQGVNLGNPLTSIRGIQYVKMALDQMLNANPMQSLGKFDKAAVAGIKSQLMDEAGKMSPEFAAANAEFARLSQPVNAMQVGQEITQRGSSAQTDALGNPTLYPEKFARSAANADSIAQSVTGNKNLTADKVLTPSQMQTLRAVTGDLGRQQVGLNAGKAVGSNTVQNLASAHLLASVGDSIGIKGLQDVPIIRTVGKVLDNVLKVAGIPDELKEGLARVALDPFSAESQAVLSRLTPRQRGIVTSALAPYLGRVSQATGISVSK